MPTSGTSTELHFVVETNEKVSSSSTGASNTDKSWDEQEGKWGRKTLWAYSFEWTEARP
jgi:hypothetical protein